MFFKALAHALSPTRSARSGPGDRQQPWGQTITTRFRLIPVSRATRGSILGTDNSRGHQSFVAQSVRPILRPDMLCPLTPPNTGPSRDRYRDRPRRRDRKTEPKSPWTLRWRRPPVKDDSPGPGALPAAHSARRPLRPPSLSRLYRAIGSAT